jgi:hypothetical protein
MVGQSKKKKPDRAKESNKKRSAQNTCSTNAKMTKWPQSLVEGIQRPEGNTCFRAHSPPIYGEEVGSLFS